MDLFEILNCYCTRRSSEVSNEDKNRNAFMLRRLFSTKFPIQCELVNRLDSNPLGSANIVSMLAMRYNGLPDFLRLKISQKKKKETIRSHFEDDVLNKYMEINECGIREVEEAYNFHKAEVEKSLNLIKNNFFNDKEKVIIKKPSKDKDTQEKNDKLW